MWGPAALWAAVLFFLSSIPDTGGLSWIPVSDKVAHIALYAVLGGALAYGRTRADASMDRATPADRSVAAHGWLLGAGWLYALTDEWHQAYVPGRSPDPADWLADAVGLTVGYGTTWVLLGRTTDDPSRKDLHDRDAS